MIKETKRFETIWRNQFLTSEAKTIDDMIEGLLEAADMLQAMKDDGIELDPDGGTEDDYAFLVTTDEKVAEAWGFEEVDDECRCEECGEIIPSEELN